MWFIEHPYYLSLVCGSKRIINKDDLFELVRWHMAIQNDTDYTACILTLYNNLIKLTACWSSSKRWRHQLQHLQLQEVQTLHPLESSMSLRIKKQELYIGMVSTRTERKNEMWHNANSLWFKKCNQNLDEEKINHSKYSCTSLLKNTVMNCLNEHLSLLNIPKKFFTASCLVSECPYIK